MFLADWKLPSLETVLWKLSTVLGVYLRFQSTAIRGMGEITHYMDFAVSPSPFRHPPI